MHLIIRMVYILWSLYSVEEQVLKLQLSRMLHIKHRQKLLDNFSQPFREIISGLLIIFLVDSGHAAEFHCQSSVI